MGQIIQSKPKKKHYFDSSFSQSSTNIIQKKIGDLIKYGFSKSILFHWGLVVIDGIFGKSVIKHVYFNLL